MSNVAAKMRGDLVDKQLERMDRREEWRWGIVLLGFPFVGVLFGLAWATSSDPETPPPSARPDQPAELRGFTESRSHRMRRGPAEKPG